ncbi:hypothetical protein KTD31_01040 [Burkholderia multivorans]|uniref:hypothetical protein n=1 Tax=Burkholderia multivorans TaxID=87883 RepID=UPI001C22A50B|nr:hypothetical protein [Burkholderia multivorans]MBU9199987.1 hypothetical protein [Burkholderia multivorans]MDN8078894.1 hypothetical protein [Burkholderia multivorans]
MDFEQKLKGLEFGVQDGAVWRPTQLLLEYRHGPAQDEVVLVCRMPGGAALGGQVYAHEGSVAFPYATQRVGHVAEETETLRNQELLAEHSE